jgi:hypothetical protein
MEKINELHKRIINPKFNDVCFFYKQCLKFSKNLNRLNFINYFLIIISSSISTI